MFFPDSLFISANPAYMDNVLAGYNAAKDIRILFCGCVRDCATPLLRNIYRINALRPFFKKLDLFLYENNSEDETPELVKLADFYKSEKLNFPKHQRDKSVLRRSVMAYARNQYLEFAREKEYDYLAVIDMDLPGGFSSEGIFHTLSLKPAIYGANSIIYHESQRLYFDSWAYRSYESDGESEAINHEVFHKGSNPVRVDSCFGGLAIYPYKIIKEDIKYTNEDCDHVTLHKQLRELGYKIYLNPSMITLYTESSYDKCNYPDIRQ